MPYLFILKKKQWQKEKQTMYISSCCKSCCSVHFLPNMKSAPYSSNVFLRESIRSCVVCNAWITAFFIPGTTSSCHWPSRPWLDRKVLNWSSDHMLSAGMPPWRSWEGLRCFWMELLHRWTELKGRGEVRTSKDRGIRGNEWDSVMT